MTSSFSAEIKLVLKGKDASVQAPGFGRGVAALCENVERLGSLNKAAKEMNMAYSKAWRIMNNAEEVLGVTLIQREGAHGSFLTEEGKRVVRAYRLAEQKLAAVVDEVLDGVFLEVDSRA